MAINSISSGVPSLASGLGGSTQSAAPGFGDILKNMVNQTAAAAQNAEALTLAVAQGESVPLTDVVQAVSRAELTLSTLITVRDRAVEAYQQIQQMPI